MSRDLCQIEETLVSKAILIWVSFSRLQCSLVPGQGGMEGDRTVEV